MRFIKPLDEQLVLEMAAEHEALVTVEENVVSGGAGSAINEVLAAADVRLPVLNLGIPDRFIEHGSRDDGLRAAGLDPAALERRILEWARAKGVARDAARREHPALACARALQWACQGGRLTQRQRAVVAGELEIAASDRSRRPPTTRTAPSQ